MTLSITPLYDRVLQGKAEEVRNKEDEVDNIQTSSRMFEESLKVSNVPTLYSN